MIEPGTTYRIHVLEEDPDTGAFLEREIRLDGTELERVRVHSLVPIPSRDGRHLYSTPADIEQARPEDA